MQVTAAIHKKIWPIKKQQEFDGWMVPWEASGYAEDFEISKKVGGAFDLSHLACISLEGPDAKDYLQRMTTVDFKKLKSGDLSYGAFLTGKGTVVSLGVFLVTEKSFDFWITPNQVEATLAHIEKFHFAEKFTSKDASQEWALVGLWKPSPGLCDEFQIKPEFPSQRLEWRRWRSMDCDMWRDSVRKDLFFLRTVRNHCDHFLEHLKEVLAPLLGTKLFEYFRMQAEIPAYGPEANDHVIILETGFEAAVSRNKGCYPGQEVVERIFTYGSVNKKLMRVNIQGTVPTLPVALHHEGKEVGRLVSAIALPDKSGKALGLAFLHKDFWTLRDTTFTF